MPFHGATESDITHSLVALKSALKTRLGTSLEKLVMFGSRARGDYNEESDIDIAVIVNRLDRNLKKEVIDLVADIELEYLVPLSTLVLSSQAHKVLMQRERRIALDIEREGVPLWRRKIYGTTSGRS